MVVTGENQAILELEPINLNTLKVSRSEVSDSFAGRGTVRHEVFIGDKVSEYADDMNLQLRVSCREDAGKLELPIVYSIAATLESKANLPIYEQIKEKLKQPVLITSAG